MSDNPKSDDLISLEDVVRDSGPAAAAGAPGDGAPQDEVDRLFAIEDPEFAASMQELAAAPASQEGEVDVDADLDSILARERSEAGATGFRKLSLLILKRPVRWLKQFFVSLGLIFTRIRTTGVTSLKDAAIAIFHGLKAFLKKSLETLKKLIASFRALSLKSKLFVMSTAVLVVGLAFVLKITFLGHGLPKLDVKFIRSFADVADVKYTFEKEEAWEDLNNPFFHPEHVVMIERIVVNLRPPGDGSNPMALADLYLEASVREAAIELNDREAEVRDLLGRTLEQMTYEELVTPPGKNKFKIFARKNLNDILTKGRVRRVYLKTIVLKP